MRDYSEIEEIAIHYGLENQLGKLSEELRELDLAAMLAQLDLVSHGEISDESRFNLIDELADVLIMTGQISYLVDIQSEVLERMDFKINRQLERIAVEVNNEQPDS